MIVDCLSCGATYNISDEKVRGRRVRVRCKSCGEGIIVDGIRTETEDATRVYAPNFEPAAYSAGRDEATRVMTVTATAGLNEPAEDEWTVNISETEQRTMRLEEIVSGYGSGLVDDNAYVWKDGMADWVPLREISEIRAALEYVETTRVVSPSALKPPQAQRPSPMPPKAPYAGLVTPRIPSAPPPPLSAPAAMPPPSAPPLAPAVAVSVPAAVPTQVGGFPAPPPPSMPPPPPSARTKVTYSAPAPPPRPFVRGPEPAASVEYQAPELNRAPPPAKVRETRQRADLFGNSSAIGSEDELLRSESVPLSAYDEKPTGQRNESSVLFSLDTLKAGARRGTPSSAPPRAMAAAPPTAADILGMSAGGALPSAPSLLSAPVIDARPPPPPPPPLVTAVVTEATVPRARMDTTPPTSRVKPKTGLLIAVVIIGAVVVAGAAALVFKDRFMTPRPVPEAEAKPAPTVAPAKPPPVAPPPEPPTTAVATAETTPPPVAPVETTAPAPEKPPAREPETKHAGAPRPPAVAPAPKPERAPAQDDSEALKSAIRSDDKATKEPAAEKVVLEEANEAPESPGAPAAPPEEAAKPPFDTGAAKAALASAASGVAGCKKPFNPTGSGRVQVTFAPSGKATAATLIEGSFDGTPVGSCVTKLFRGARVPAFSGDPVTVAKSFSIPE